MKPKKTGLTREQAAELYRDLQQSMSTLRKRAAAGEVPQPPKGDAAPQTFPMTAPHPLPVPGRVGHVAALTFVITLACSRAVLSGLEAWGIGGVETAQASLMQQMQMEAVGQNSQERSEILSALDNRRVELEKRKKALAEKEDDIARREREFAAKLVELRSLTERLKLEREKNEKKRGAQLDQLANVYGSMNPQEAAQLIQQLDVTIALALIQRMPEKRIGQILALMDREKALSLTQMLTATSSM